MKILFSMIYISISLSLKICINCKHFISDNKENIFGKCKMFPQIENKMNFLVNGIKKMDIPIVQLQDHFQICVGKMGKCLKENINV